MRLQAILLGAGFGLGLVFFAIGVRRLPRPATRVAGRLAGLARGRGPVQVAAALAGAALVALTTRWLVGAVLAALALWTLPRMLMGAERARQTRLQRLEGIASWTESLVATLGGAAGLEQTIIATAPTTPAPIRAPVILLADALQRGVRLPTALQEFAGNLADPMAEPIVASLLLASTEGAGRLGEPLTILAAAAREEVAAQRRVEKGRAKAATDARLIILTTLAMAVGLVVFNRGYLRPYDSVTGQIVLAVVGAMFAVGFWWLHKLSQPKDIPRVLDLSAGRYPQLTGDAGAVVVPR
jgi:hypothetical protein